MRHKARDSGVKFALLLLLCHHISLLPGKRLTRICYVIGFQIIRIHPFTRYRIRGRFFFPFWRADLKISGFAAEFAGCVWTVAVSEKVADSKISGYVWTGPQFTTKFNLITLK